MAVGVVGSCGSDDDHPYDALSREAFRYVIPESGGWGPGRLCPDGGACSGAITIEVIERYDWFHITDTAIAGDDTSDGSVQVGVDPEIDYAAVFSAFDAEGRLAGVGTAADAGGSLTYDRIAAVLRASYTCR